MPRATPDFNHFVGERISSARKEEGVTQEHLSSKLGFKDRQILSNIENGLRRISPEELLIVIRELRRPLEYFTDPYQLPATQLFSWRADDENVAHEYEERARNLVCAHRRFSDLTGRGLTPIMPQLAITKRSTYDDVQRIGNYLADYWKMDDRPADRLESVIRDDLKIELFFVDMPNAISGSSLWVNDFCAIFINREHPSGRRNFSLAHEFFHVLTWNTFHPSSFVPSEWEKVKDRSEKFANCFASALLMPERVLQSLEPLDQAPNLKDWLETNAQELRVSPDALFWRMVNIGRLKRDQKPADLFAPFSDPPDKKPLPLSKRFVEMLEEVIANGDVSVRKILSLLQCQMEDLEAVFTAHNKPAPFAL